MICLVALGTRPWLARTVSQWRDILNFVTLALRVFDLIGTGVGVAAVVGAEILPVLLVSPVAGVVVDRVSPARVMVAADVARVALAGVLALTHRHVPVIYALAFGLSVGSVFFNPAAGALPPALVNDDELVTATSGVWTAAVLSQILLAPVAGALVAARGDTLAFAINTISFVISALLLGGLPVAARPPRRDAEPSWIAQARHGFGTCGRRPAAACRRRGAAARRAVCRGDERAPRRARGGPHAY